VLKAAEFVPSWCQAQSPEQQESSASAEPSSFGRAETAEDGELAVAKAIERISAQTKDDRSKNSQVKKEKKQPQASNLEVRHYVRQVLSDELDEKVKAMLADLSKFQERARERDPQKFAKLKRFCVGMSEATRSVKRGKAKCLIVAPNLDKSEADGGLDDTVEDLMDVCFEHEVPIIFALSRNRMGKALGKNIRISIVCVLSVEGVHQEFRQIVKIAEELRKQWVMRRMALGAQEVIAQCEAEEAEASGDDAGAPTATESMNDRVLRHLEEKRQAEERIRLEEKAKRDAEKAVVKEQKAAERRAKQEARRAELQAQKEEEARKEEEEQRRKDEEDVEKRRMQAEREKERQLLVEKARAEKERKAEAERKRIAERDAQAAAAAGINSDDSSDEDLPTGFNADFF
jgi:ribosomal protein L7Ae-like RNA K-turn-binding protein